MTSTSDASPTDTGPPRTVVPADIDAPDRIAWGLSFRQLSILAAAGAAMWMAYQRGQAWFPTGVWIGIAVPVMACAAAIALGRRDGQPLDVWIRHGLSMHTNPRLLAPGEKPTGPALITTRTPQPRPVVPAPLRSPLTRIDADGMLQVEGTHRSLIACGTTSVALRTAAEQTSMLEGFGRWLNSLTQPAQIVVAAARHDLTPHANTLLDAAPRLPHPALRQAAADHAAFLLDLDADREPLRRQVLTVVTGQPAREAGVRGLSGLGISTRLLDAGDVSAALTTAADPYNPPPPGPRAAPGHPVTATTPTTGGGVPGFGHAGARRQP